MEFNFALEDTPLNFDEKMLNDNLKQLEVADVTSEKLNKLLSILTPENLDMVVYDGKLLKIDSAENMKECVDVIFANAVNSELTSTFAIFCTRVLYPSVPIMEHSNKMITFKEKIQQKARHEVENFLENQYLKNKGIHRAESESSDETVEITPNGDEKHVVSSCVKRLKRTFSLFRFVGALYIEDMLESSQVMFTLTQLLETVYCNESSLEVFSVLMRTVGGKMEIQCNVDLTDIFEKMEERRDTITIKPHTRFMLEEIYVKRLSDWEEMDERDWVDLYNSFLYDVEEKLYILELCYGR